MSKQDRANYKILNKMVSSNEFEDKNPDDYIYASMSAPPIKVIDKKNTDDEMEWLVECPRCNKTVQFGTSIYMRSGKIYCEKCQDTVDWS